MISTKWKDIAELIGFTAIIASLIFVGLQLRQDQQVANLESLVAGQFTEFELSRLIAENSDTWVRGLNNEELTQAEEAKFESVANALFRFSANSYRAQMERGYSREQIRPVLNTYAFFIYQYPGLRRKFYERVNAMQLRDRTLSRLEELRFYPKLVDERLKELDAMSPETPTGNYVPL